MSKKIFLVVIEDSPYASRDLLPIIRSTLKTKLEPIEPDDMPAKVRVELWNDIDHQHPAHRKVR